MTPLGKSLVFYLKYWAEMERLWPAAYGGDTEDIANLPDPARVLPMVKAVCDVANREAVEFLTACADAMEEPLSAYADYRRVRGRVWKSWGIGGEVWLPTRKGSIAVGVQIKGKIRKLVPWIWSQGGRRVEEPIIRVLGRGVPSRTQELVYSSGTVGLEGIPLLPANLEGFDVDRELIVRRVGELFAELTREKLEAILALQATADEPT